MRKLMIVLLTMALGMPILAGCQDNNNNPSNGGTKVAAIVGDWEYENGGFDYSFKSDGTGVYTVVGTAMSFTYEIDLSKLTLTFDDGTDPKIFSYVLDQETLIITDQSGNDIVYKRK
jgi:hypothetical protein